MPMTMTMTPTTTLTVIAIIVVSVHRYTQCHDDHRLNGSSSPVLTATCLSYGSFCDFLTFSPTDLEGTPLDRF